MPGRPLLKFLGLYFLKRGFLDGYAGFAYSVLIGFYEYLIVLKGRELSAEGAQVKASHHSGVEEIQVESGKPSREKVRQA